MDQIQPYSGNIPNHQIIPSMIASSFTGKVKTSADNSYGIIQSASVAVKYHSTTSKNVQRKSNVQMCAFGILSNHFRVFSTSVTFEIHKVETIVLTACIVHNYMGEESLKHTDVSDAEDARELIPGEWRTDSKPKQASLTSGTDPRLPAIVRRENRVTYLNAVGAVPCQMGYIKKLFAKALNLTN